MLGYQERVRRILEGHEGVGHLGGVGEARVRVDGQGALHDVREAGVNVDAIGEGNVVAGERALRDLGESAATHRRLAHIHIDGWMNPDDEIVMFPKPVPTELKPRA